MIKIMVAVLVVLLLFFLMYFLFKPRKTTANTVSRQASPRKKSSSVKRFDGEDKLSLATDKDGEYDVLGLKIDKPQRDALKGGAQSDSPSEAEVSEDRNVCAPSEKLEVEASNIAESEGSPPEKGGRSNESEVKIPAHVIHHILPSTKPFFSGHELLQNLIACGFKLGKHAIFDYSGSKGGSILFSLAQSENPGTFDIERIANCRCRGLALFFSPSQVKNPVLSYEELLQNANVLIESLGGRLVNEHMADLNSDESDAIRMSMIQAMSVGLNQVRPEKV